jgi:hypothetical protein
MSTSSRRLPLCNPEVHSVEFDHEVLVSNPDTNEAHLLSGAAAQVWRAAGAGGEVSLTDAELEPVIEELIALGLLIAPGYSRRTVLRSSALGGAAIAVAGITSIALPAAAAAYSNSGMTTYTAGTAIPVIVNPGQTVTYTLIGGGGGGGATLTDAGGAGGNGGVISGSYSNSGGGQVPLFLTIGIGGSPGTGTGGAGGSGFTPYTTTSATGGAGLAGTSGIVGSGGGGGGATGLYSTNTALAVGAAAGGGGGSGGGGLSAGVAGGCAGPRRGGGGGGAVGGTGGNGGTTASASTAGDNYASTGATAIGSATGYGGGGAAGAAGQAGAAYITLS